MAKERDLDGVCFLGEVPQYASRVTNPMAELAVMSTRAVPGVLKAVRWNAPFYGIEVRGWFLSFHCFTK